MSNDREACGRCSMTTAVDVANANRDGNERSARDPYDGDRIEIDEGILRRVSPGGWLSGLSNCLDSAVDSFTWGR
ncbi:hypothetical protein HALLA_15920 [Halostagnicola larsenii XH-48]|uniref:Uncharacterized protein n=1 Tax=Halostagnicola larsenii XH-48 TaxID=797299 RepID=W0JMX2_9EURY|nr:hypothetical protein [Halostagnicola larsenii]AHG00066.1 hypothetical protein HALLA_15920 [Halostagnicola larsenii XH-48]